MLSSQLESFGSDYKSPATGALQGDESMFGSSHPPARITRVQTPAQPVTASTPAQQPVAPQTFADMQKAGMARPPMPQPSRPADANPWQIPAYTGPSAPELPPADTNPWQNPYPASGITPGGISTPPSGGIGDPIRTPPVFTGPDSPPAGGPGDPSIPGGITGPGGGGITAPPPSGANTADPYSSPLALPSAGGSSAFDLGQNLTDRYTGYQPPGTFTPSGNPLDSQTQGSIADFLSNPSRYGSDALKSNYDLLGGQIDDEYNAKDQSLKADMASRGLGDSTIYGNDQRYQNLLRRSAKGDLANGLLQGEANTDATDRSSAINAAMGYGTQKYGEDLSTYGANLAGQNQGATQQQNILNSLMGYGQNQFANQATTAGINNQQQQQYQQLLMQLLGYGT